MHMQTYFWIRFFFLTICLSFQWAFNCSWSSVPLLSCVWLFATPRTAAHQASLSVTNSWSLLKLTSIESVMPSNNLILCRPLLLLPSIFPSIEVFSNESVLCIRWPKWRYHFKENVFLWLLTTEPPFLGNLVQALLSVRSGEVHNGVQGCLLKVSVILPAPIPVSQTPCIHRNFSLRMHPCPTGHSLLGILGLSPARNPLISPWSPPEPLMAPKDAPKLHGHQPGTLCSAYNGGRRFATKSQSVFVYGHHNPIKLIFCCFGGTTWHAGS